MKPAEKQERIKTLFLRLSQMPESERAAALEKECATDPSDVRAEVEALLNANQAAGSQFLGSPVLPAGIDNGKPVEEPGPSVPVDPTLDPQRGGSSEIKPAGTLPERIGRYQVTEFISRGSFGIVYRAVDPELSREVAIKVPRKGVIDNAIDVEDYLNEARTIAQLAHPSIVPVYDFGRTADGSCYVVSRYIDGSNLKEAMADGGFSVYESAQLVAALADALQHAHTQEIVHRDVKPANVLLDETGRPMLTDFGLALRAESFGGGAGICGTVAYMSPEQAQGKSDVVDGRSDIYSLGVILYELLTRKSPYRATGVKSLLLEIADESIEIRPPRQADSSIPPALERVCLRALQKRRVERYTTAADFATELRKVIPVPKTPAAPRVAAILVAAVLLLLLLGRILLPVSAPPRILQGELDVMIWNPEDQSRTGVSLFEPSARPLRKGDQIRIAASLNRPSYVYLFWIDSEANAHPVYPWTPGNWDEKSSEEQPKMRFSLPEVADEAWPMGGPSGMEILLLLAREQPLPQEVDLRTVFSELPQRPLDDPKALVWLENGRVSGSQDRSPQFFNAKQVDDPVLSTLRLIEERLPDGFPLRLAVSFGYADE